MRSKILLFCCSLSLLSLQKSSAQNCTLTCPKNLVASNALHKCGAAVSYPTPTLSGNCSGVTLSSSPASGSFFPVGTTTVTTTARNAAGTVIATCSFSVTVNDTEAPVISNLSANPNSLWPPNHKMVPVSINFSATDNCPGTPSCHLSVTSNEPINSTGDGNTSPDWTIVNNHLVDLRAERKGNGTGRVYTVTVTCSDQHGNTSKRSTAVTVNHDQGNNREGKDLNVKAQPNPSKNSFTLLVQSSNLHDAITIKIYDWSSRVVDSKVGVSANQTITLGSNLKPGVYFVQVQQGSTIEWKKLVKE